MLKKFKILLFIAFCNHLVVAQSIDEQRKSLQSEISHLQLLTNAKARLAKQLQVGDTTGSYNLIALIRQEGDSCEVLPFSEREEIAIAFYFEKWQDVLSVLERDMYNTSPYRSKIARGSISYDILKGCDTRLNNALTFNQANDLEKQFLFIVYKSLFNYPAGPRVTFDESYRDIAIFKKNKLPSRIQDIYNSRAIKLRKSIPLGFGVEFASGYSQTTGQLRNYMKYDVPFLVAFDLYKNRFFLSLRDYIGFSSAASDISLNGHYPIPKDKQLRVYVPEVSLGYAVFDNKYFRLTPFLGYGATAIDATDGDKQKDPKLNDAGFFFTETYSLGAALDLILSRTEYLRGEKKPISSSWTAIRVRYGYYRPQYYHKYGVSGQRHSITMGIAIGELLMGGRHRRAARRYH
jgi:hypothetical protein